MLSCCSQQVTLQNARNQGSSYQMAFFWSALVQFSELMWTSAVVAHLPHNLMCCVFRDALLHTLWVGLSHCCLPIRSKHSAHSPLTSDINQRFSPSELSLTREFLFFRSFSVNPRDGYVRKSKLISCFWNIQSSPSGSVFEDFSFICLFIHTCISSLTYFSFT